MPVTVSIANMAVSPPPPLQISPPLHQHLSMQQHQSLAMQQPLGSQLPMQVQTALHSPTMQQVSLYLGSVLAGGAGCWIVSNAQRGWLVYWKGERPQIVDRLTSGKYNLHEVSCQNQALIALSNHCFWFISGLFL